MKMINVTGTAAAYEREPLIRSFGFKGGYLTELWQVVTRLQSAAGVTGTGLATQSVLYADAGLFAAYAEAEGNALMFAVVKEALQLVQQTPFRDPVELLDKIKPEVQAAAARITGKKDLHPNFVYNALVSIDHAAWLLYARENGFSSFDAMIPARYRDALRYRNHRIAILYQVSYDMPVADIVAAVKAGYCVIKIKTGFPGTQEEMLAKDIARLSEIHDALKDLLTPHGSVWYTMDANARYESKALLARYLDHARHIGAFERILLYEEPFAETVGDHAGDLGVRIAADESVHEPEDVARKQAQGYSALVLKGVAKTLSQSLKIAREAHNRGIPCLCSDLTVSPVLVEWHKNLAARLAPFPGIGMGLLETNGDMNYVHWEAMSRRHRQAGAPWMERRQGTFVLDEDFYRYSGGIFDVPAHYEKLFTA